MSDTIREQIFAAISNRLQAILKTAGYNYDLGKSTYRAFLVPLDFDFLPAVGFLPGDETFVRFGGGSALFTCQVTIQAVEKFSNVLAHQVAEKLLADIEENIFGIEWSLGFDSGGSYQVTVGETITGDNSNATGYITGVNISSGSLGAGNAAGTFTIRRKNGNFQDNESLNVGSETDVATVDGEISGTSGEANTTGGLAESMDFVSSSIELPAADQEAVGASVIVAINYRKQIGNPYSQQN